LRFRGNFFTGFALKGFEKLLTAKRAKARPEYQLRCTPNCDACHRMKVEGEAGSGFHSALFLFSMALIY
jgi:hypothetical protein